MLFTLVLILLIQGLVSSDDEYKLYEECLEILIPLYNRTRDKIPDAEDLKFQCPLLKRFLDCSIMHYSAEFETGYNVGDFIVAKNFLDEWCDKNSQLHRVYTDNVECYRSMEKEWGGCKKTGEDVFSEYRTSSFAVQNTDMEELDLVSQNIAFTEPYCLINSLAAACIATKVLETCGFEAFNTFIEMLIGIRIENDFCGKEDENPFKKGFIDFLANENKTVESVLIRTMFEIEEE